MRLSRPLAAAALEISDRQSAVSPELNPPESARSAARQSECAGHARRGSSWLDLVGCLRSPLIMTHIVMVCWLQVTVLLGHYFLCVLLEKHVLMVSRSNAQCRQRAQHVPGARQVSGRKSELGFTTVWALAELGKIPVQSFYLQEQQKVVSFACVRAGGRCWLLLGPAAGCCCWPAAGCLRMYAPTPLPGPCWLPCWLAAWPTAGGFWLPQGGL
jgi:hypothetical protein